MRILHLISNLMSGGAESMLTKVVSALPADEHVVISFLRGGLFEDALRAARIRVVTLDSARSWTAARQWRRIRQVMREVSPDVVQGWMYHANLAASAAALGGYPVIWNVRQGLGRLGNTKPLTRAVILATIPFARSAAAIVYNSQRAAVEHEHYFYPAGRRVLIPNGFDLDRFRPDADARRVVRQELGLAPDSKIIAHVARYDPMKDIETLLHSFALLPEGLGGVMLVLAGRGMDPENPELRAAGQRYGIAERLRPLGERTDIPRIMAASDIVALSSRYDEGFPNVLGEAMACGIPPVATDTGECAAIIADPRRIVPPADPAALSSALACLLAMPTAERLTIGANDRARVLREYGLRAVAERYRQLWEQVASGR